MMSYRTLIHLSENPSHNFEDLIRVSELQIVGAESRESQPVQQSKTFKTKNRNFYPLHPMTASIERFQEKMEQDLVSLYNNVNTVSDSTRIYNQVNIVL